MTQTLLIKNFYALFFRPTIFCIWTLKIEWISFGAITIFFLLGATGEKNPRMKRFICCNLNACKSYGHVYHPVVSNHRCRKDITILRHQVKDKIENGTENKILHTIKSNIQRIVLFSTTPMFIIIL